MSFIDINKSFININKSFIDIDKSFITLYIRNTFSVEVSGPLLTILQSV